MADFDLTQSGQEIQNILDGAAMQTDLTAETERAEQAEQQLQGNIDAEELRAKAAEEANADDIDVIEGKIPAAASSENQLADKAFVNSSITTATATYRGAYNLVSDLHLTIDATEQQIAAALAGAISTADNNDYCFVQIPTADATPTQIAAIERYKFNGTAWAYEYTLNNSGFTAEQWAALNSGITTGLVAKLAALPTNDELTLLLGGKQNVLTFDNVPTEGSNNPVKSGGVKSAIDSEKERAQGAEQANAGNIAQVIAMIPAAASSENQLADKNFVNSSIATNTATYRGAYNEVSDLSLTVDATHEQIAAALAGAISTADNNDYCFVQVPTADATPTQIAAIERYKFNGTAWAYEYTLNNSGFTADQWAAINSGITSGMVAKLAALPTNDELTLLLAGKQPMLTFDNVPTESSTNPVKSGGVYAAIAEEAGTRAAAIAAIVALIPSAASALNQLADKAFVNSSISTATAVFKGTFNVVADLELNYNASQAQIALMLGSKIASADNNDYCFVQIPTSNETPLEIARTDRYKYNGTAWAYEYTLNNSGFTAAQWAAINSGITSLLKDKLIDLPTATELATQLAAKQNALTFDTTPTEGSTNPVTSDGIHAAIDTEKARAEAAEADRYTKSETYNKTEINGLVSTPHQNYVTVPTYASLPSSGQSTDTIYRVSSYDGVNSQVDNTVYSEYAWDGTQYVFLDVKSQIEEVFDITEYNSGTKYADLSAALGVDGANIPATLRRGGMSIKYVQTYDNKYAQYRLMSDSFNTDTTQWAIDNTGVYIDNQEFLYVKTDSQKRILFAIRKDGEIYFGVGCPQQIKDAVVEFVEPLLNLKVDKEDGKSLINEDYAQRIGYIENDEFLSIKVDANNRILEAIKKDGTKEYYGNVSIGGNVHQNIDNPEFIYVLTDNNKRIVFAVTKDGQIVGDLKGLLQKINAEIDKFSESIDGDMVNKRLICCDGDSLTYSQVSTGQSKNPWPNVLQNALGDGYKVFNYGIPGAPSATLVGNATNFRVDTAFTIPDSGTSGFFELSFLRSKENVYSWTFGPVISHDTMGGSNPCWINGIKGKLNYAVGANDEKGATFTREKEGNAVNVSVGDLVLTNEYVKNNNADHMIFIGTNGGWRLLDEHGQEKGIQDTDSINELMGQIDNIINVSNDLFIVLSYYGWFVDNGSGVNITPWAGEELFAENYGLHYINLREYFATDAIYDAIDRGYLPDDGTYPTAADLAYMSYGRPAPTFIWDQVHLTDVGYQLVGDLVSKTYKSLLKEKVLSIN